MPTTASPICTTGRNSRKKKEHMGQVTVRLADQLDFPFLREELKAQDVDEVDLAKCITVIAEYEGKPFCSISGQLAWFIEPHMVFNAEGLSDSTIRRGLLMTYRK